MRPKAGIWKHFHRDDSHGPNIKAKCRKCGHSLQRIISRMERHWATHDDKNENDSDVEFTGLFYKLILLLKNILEIRVYRN